MRKRKDRRWFWKSSFVYPLCITFSYYTLCSFMWLTIRGVLAGYLLCFLTSSVKKAGATVANMRILNQFNNPAYEMCYWGLTVKLNQHTGKKPWPLSGIQGSMSLPCITTPLSHLYLTYLCFTRSSCENNMIVSRFMLSWHEYTHHRSPN